MKKIKHYSNLDKKVVMDFGSEWSQFDQSNLSDFDRREMYDGYFQIFPWELLSSSAIGADIGCGSGRWALLVAPRVGHLYLVDPSNEALNVAKRNLRNTTNTSFLHEPVDSISIKEASLDFAYSLGVLHHVPDTLAAIKSIAHLLKPGAPFLIYLYYRFDNRPWWFRILWHISDYLRRLISKLPFFLKHLICEFIALSVYFPLARFAALVERIGFCPYSLPLSYYRHRRFYVMRTDALDRFGTRLERRFNQNQIKDMMISSGFSSIKFSCTQPFWCVVGIKE
jgi:ubiquinone/menaquinone biosynthesis C-methylase UbiE